MSFCWGISGSKIELPSSVGCLRQSITAINVTVDKSTDNNSVWAKQQIKLWPFVRNEHCFWERLCLSWKTQTQLCICADWFETEFHHIDTSVWTDCIHTCKHGRFWSNCTSVPFDQIHPRLHMLWSSICMIQGEYIIQTFFWVEFFAISFLPDVFLDDMKIINQANWDCIHFRVWPEKSHKYDLNILPVYTVHKWPVFHLSFLNILCNTE